jgi:uncharacterized protein
MFLSIKDMEIRKVRFDETFQPGAIDFSDAELRQVTPLHAEGFAVLLAHTDGEIRIRGRLQVEMESECDRCLGPAFFPLSADFDLFYRPMASIARDEEVGIDEGEAEIGFYEGAGLEVADIVKEQVLLNLPMQRICSEACKGICPICGSNRNESNCQCEVKPLDDRWKALRNL